MIFNQFEFLFLFLPVTVGLSLFLLHGASRIYFLTACSLFFYGMSGITHAVFLFICIVWVHLVTRMSSFMERKQNILLAISPPLLGLLYYKYSPFLFHSLSALLGAEMMEKVDPFVYYSELPAGISFFAFQLAAYAVDRFSGDDEADFDFKTFALYITFFPQLVAGPILRANDVSKKLHLLDRFTVASRDFADGLVYVVFGLAWKVLIADRLGAYAEPMFKQASALSPLTAAYATLAYSFQIYFDFYGYSLIAIGLGLWFGLRLPDNFRQPYLARNPRDFWRRWHISLSFFIRDYLYIPLGGNEKYVRNILVTFAICGLWHGAAWTFVIWGVYHAMLVSGYSLVRRWWEATPVALQILMNFVLVSLGWILFVLDFRQTTLFLRSLFGFGAGGSDFVLSPQHWGMLTIACLASVLVKPELLQRQVSEMGAARSLATGAGLGVLFFATLLYIGKSGTFIYFRF